MNDMINPTTGAPCKGKLAAQALLALVLDPRLSGTLARLGLLAQAESALVPFGWPDRETLAKKLGNAPAVSATPVAPPAPTHYDVLVDYDTREVLRAVSHEMRAKYEQAQREGRAFVETYISCVKHRVAIERRPITAGFGAAPHVGAAPIGAAKVLVPATKLAIVKARALPVAPESDADLGAESSMDLYWPHCHCPTPTRWATRRLDGPWAMGPGEPTMEQRTCETCGATKSREIGR